MAYCKDNPIEMLKDEAREGSAEIEAAARAMLAALVDIEQLGATAATLARVRKAISTATAAGIRLTWQD